MTNQTGRNAHLTNFAEVRPAAGRGDLVAGANKGPSPALRLGDGRVGTEADHSSRISSESRFDGAILVRWGRQGASGVIRVARGRALVSDEKNPRCMPRC